MTFQAERIDRAVEFVASTDNWFRPVNFVECARRHAARA